MHEQVVSRLLHWSWDQDAGFHAEAMNAILPYTYDRLSIGSGAESPDHLTQCKHFMTVI